MLSLADAILQENIEGVRQCLRFGQNVNELDEYGFLPLIEAAIVENIEITRILLEHGAAPDLQDVVGGTALQWAAENNNLELCKLLLEYHANPNAYNFAGQPVLVMPMLRQHKPLKKLLVRAGADEIFAQDYINTKLLGHLFELVGTANIVDPQNKYVEVDFEGFYLEVTLSLIGFSLAQFQNHYASRSLRRYAGIGKLITDVISNAAQLIKYQQYRVDINKHLAKINSLLSQELLLIPVAYEGHAITFVRYHNIWIKCDRREDSRLYDHIAIYQANHPEQLTTALFRKLVFVKQNDQFINQDLDNLLGLQPITEVKVDAQISGNCTWANVEATIPAIFFIMMMQLKRDGDAVAQAKSQALNYFHRWREWNKDRALDFCIQRFHQSDMIRKASSAEILAAILFQRCHGDSRMNRDRIQRILSVFVDSPYQYILKNYLRVYYFQSPTEEGRQFSELLKEYGFNI